MMMFLRSAALASFLLVQAAAFPVGQPPATSKICLFLSQPDHKAPGFVGFSGNDYGASGSSPGGDYVAPMQGPGAETSTFSKPGGRSTGSYQTNNNNNHYPSQTYEGQQGGRAPYNDRRGYEQQGNGQNYGASSRRDFGRDSTAQGYPDSEQGRTSNQRNYGRDSISQGYGEQGRSRDEYGAQGGYREDFGSGRNMDGYGYDRNTRGNVDNRQMGRAPRGSRDFGEPVETYNVGGLYEEDRYGERMMNGGNYRESYNDRRYEDSYRESDSFDAEPYSNNNQGHQGENFDLGPNDGPRGDNFDLGPTDPQEFGYDPYQQEQAPYAEQFDAPPRTPYNDNNFDRMRSEPQNSNRYSNYAESRRGRNAFGTMEDGQEFTRGNNQRVHGARVALGKKERYVRLTPDELKQPQNSQRFARYKDPRMERRNNSLHTGLSPQERRREQQQQDFSRGTGSTYFTPGQYGGI